MPLPDRWWQQVQCPTCNTRTKKCKRPSGHDAMDWHRARQDAAIAAFPNEFKEKK